MAKTEKMAIPLKAKVLPRVKSECCSLMVSDDLRQRMKHFHTVRWAQYLRQQIELALAQLEERHQRENQR